MACHVRHLTWLLPAMCWGWNFCLAAGSWTWQLIGSWFCSGEVARSSHLEGGAIGSFTTLHLFIHWKQELGAKPCGISFSGHHPPSSFWANFVFCARYTRTYTHACVFYSNTRKYWCLFFCSSLDWLIDRQMDGWIDRYLFFLSMHERNIYIYKYKRYICLLPALGDCRRFPPWHGCRHLIIANWRGGCNHHQGRRRCWRCSSNKFPIR